MSSKTTPYTIPTLVQVSPCCFPYTTAGLWVLSSLGHRFRVSGARMKAQAMVEAQRAATLRTCGKCRNAIAVVVCTTHNSGLCPTCWGDHHQAGCSYAHLPAT